MSTVTGKAQNYVELNAVVYPPCVCGEPWAKHGACGGYTPTGPKMDYGTIYFGSGDWLANMLHRVERVFTRLRIARMRRL